MSRRSVVILLIFVLIVGLIIYTLLDPAENMFPKCPFYILTNLKCPGCGSQRAIHQLLHLNIVEAFRYNAFLVLCIPLIAVLGIAEIFKERVPRLYNFSKNTYFSWGILCFVILWWILRNIFGW